MINLNSKLNNSSDKPATYTMPRAVTVLSDGGVGPSRSGPAVGTVPHTPQRERPAGDTKPHGAIDMSLIGQRFGRLTVVAYRGRGYAGEGKAMRPLFLCACDCGTEILASRKQLLKKDRQSCGCISRNRHDLANAKSVHDARVAAHRQYLLNYRQGARARKLDFQLSGIEFVDLVAGDCFYCGAKPIERRYKVGQPILVNGIDRMDSSRGYTVDNCVPCCTTCNFAKRDMPMLDFINWLTRVTQHMNRQEPN